jgi:hypothetical protein
MQLDKLILPQYITELPENWIKGIKLLICVSDDIEPLSKRKRKFFTQECVDEFNALDTATKESSILLNAVISDRLGFLSLVYPLSSNPLERSQTSFKWNDEQYTYQLLDIPFEEFDAAAALINEGIAKQKIIECARLATKYGKLLDREGELALDQHTLFAVYSQLIYIHKIFQ